MSLEDDAILCHGKSWINFCIICEEEAYREYIQEMGEDYENEGGDE